MEPIYKQTILYFMQELNLNKDIDYYVSDLQQRQLLKDFVTKTQNGEKIYVISGKIKSVFYILFLFHYYIYNNEKK